MKHNKTILWGWVGIAAVVLASFAIDLLGPESAKAQPQSPTMQVQADFHIERDNITTVSVNIPFGLTASIVEIRMGTGNTADIAIDYQGGTAVCPAANTAGNQKNSVGLQRILDDVSYASISVIACSGTQTFQVSAWQ